MESSPHFKAVSPVNPAAPYIGGKRYLARRLVDLIETVPHLTYAEPFVGMGGVFLRRRSRPRVEVINDWSLEVATFYRVLQRHYLAFVELMRFYVTARAEFERLTATDPDTLTDLERAARFLYLQRTAFGGKVHAQHFGVSHHRAARFDMTRIGPMLDELQERLAGVIIERLPWQAFLSRYDTPETLFYLDPPYWGSEGDYGPALFGQAEFQLMAEALGHLKGRFILSLNDTPDVRATFCAFEIASVTTSYGIAGKGARPAREVIIQGR